MALKIIENKIVGTIENLEDKLEGKLPVDRLELLYLVNSWGRTESFYIFDINQDIYIKAYESKECYDLSELDTSEITNMESIFEYSNYNGDISNWDVSNVTNMADMFYQTKKFNQAIGNWDVSNVTNMKRLFNGATSFNQDISKWDVSNVVNMYGMFNGSKSFNQNISNWKLDSIIYATNMFLDVKAFINRYNSGKTLPNETDSIKDWFNLNRDRMNEISIKDQHGEEIDNFFSNITDIYSTNRIGLHENLLTECNKSSNRMQQAICL